MSAPFQRISAGRAVLWVDPDLAPAVESLGLLQPGALDRALGSRPAGPQGRAATSVLSLPDRSERLHLRPLRHGGWLAPLWRDGVAGLARARAEREAPAALRLAGAPVPVPARVGGHRRGLLWQAALGTLYEEDTANAADFLARVDPRDDPPDDPMWAVWAARAAARAIRRFHDAGGQHADLHIGNLLVRERSDQRDRCEVLIVDLDQARHGAVPSPARRMAELMRLYRSLEKRSLVESLGARGVAAFFTQYTGGDRALRSALLSHLPGEQRRIARHAWLWRSGQR